MRIIFFLKLPAIANKFILVTMTKFHINCILHYIRRENPDPNKMQNIKTRNNVKQPYPSGISQLPKFHELFNTIILQDFIFLKTTSMKSVLLYAIASVLAINCANAQWTRLNSPTKNKLTAVSFLNTSVGYAVGIKGTVLKTSNGGDTWTVQTAPDTANLTSVVVIDASTVLVTTVVAGGKASIYKSTNSGQDWRRVLQDNISFYATKTPDGRVFSISTYIYSSSNNGDTWKTGKRLNSTSIYTHIEFPNNKHGYIAGNIKGSSTYTPEFLRTEDEGKNWYVSYPFAFPDTSGYAAMSAMNADTVFMFTNYFKQFQPKKNTELLSLTRFRLKDVIQDSLWNFRGKVQLPRLFDIIYGCKFLEGGYGFAVGDIGVVYATNSYGKAWAKEYNDKEALYGIYMFNEKRGFAVGDSGVILKRNAAAPFTDISSESLPLKVYPNPSNNSSVVSFTLNKQSDIMLQVADEKGVIVYSKQAKQYNAGTYQITIPVANLQRGVYHINLITDGKPVSKTDLLVVH